MFNGDSGSEFVSEFEISRARVWPDAQRKSTGKTLPCICEIVCDPRQIEGVVERNEKATTLVNLPKQTGVTFPAAKKLAQG
jgi:hypothetical protein